MTITSEQIAQAIDRWGGRLRYWLHNKTHDADDILQETFCKLVQQSRMPERPAAWLFQVAANLVREEVRRNQRRKLREQRVAPPEATQGTHDHRMVQAEVQMALAKLPVELRDVVLLKIWGDMTFAEIAKTTGLSTATAHRRYEEAMLQLRKLCAPDGLRDIDYESAH